jgi:ribosomal 30S subunit maturation factor RimM
LHFLGWGDYFVVEKKDRKALIPMIYSNFKNAKCEKMYIIFDLDCVAFQTLTN